MSKNVLAKYRGAVLTRGILAILVGLLMMLYTGATLQFIIILIGVFALIDGAILIIGSFTAKEHNKWWVFLVEGLLSLAFGIILFSWPAMTVILMLYIVAIWAIITGLMEMIVGFAEEEGVVGKWLLATTGVLSLIIGVLMLLAPAKTLEIVVWLIGLYAFVVGVAMTIFGIQIKAKN